MIIAVAIMRVVKPTVDEITHVVAMRHRLVTAAWSVDMIGIMTQCIGIDRGTGIGICCRNLDHMFIYVIFVRVMQMAIVKVVDMITVPDRCVAAARSVNMCMVGVFWQIASHACSPSVFMVVGKSSAACSRISCRRRTTWSSARA